MFVLCAGKFAVGVGGVGGWWLVRGVCVVDVVAAGAAGGWWTACPRSVSHYVGSGDLFLVRLVTFC